MASTVDSKLLRRTKFPPEFSRKVDMNKVNVKVMRKWIASKISNILGNEDDVVVELCFNLLESSRFPDIKALQISLTGFLDKDTPKFCKELWNLCLSAQDNTQGVPKELLEAKKLELLQEKMDAEKMVEQTNKLRDREETQHQQVNAIRQHERAERHGGRDRGVAGREDHSFASRRRRELESPPQPKARSSDQRSGFYARRETDSYVPEPRHGSGSAGIKRDRPSSPTRSRSRSRSRSLSPHSHRRRRYSSRLKSPPHHRRPFRAPSRSVSPAGRRYDRRSRRSVSLDNPSRSTSHTTSDHYPPPRRHKKSSSTSSYSSRSSSLPRHIRTDKRAASAQSRSKSPRASFSDKRSRRNKRDSRSSSHESYDEEIRVRADLVKDRVSRDDRRLSRSRDRLIRKRHHSRGRSRSRSSDGDRSIHRDGKRRRSLQRWAPPARKRRNTSSVTPHDKSSAAKD